MTLRDVALIRDSGLLAGYLLAERPLHHRSTGHFHSCRASSREAAVSRRAET
jgi:hypothetical protein